MCHGIPRDLDLTLSLKGQEERKGISSAENTFCGGGAEHPSADGLV